MAIPSPSSSEGPVPASPSDRPEPPHRRARFAVPPPPGGRAGADRLRLVDPTGCAVAWLGYGEGLGVLGFVVQADDGSWREVLREVCVEVTGAVSPWTLVERDPTMARLRDAAGVEVTAGIDGGVLVIARADVPLLVAGPEGCRA